MIEYNNNDNNEILIFNPYNPVNKEITENEVCNILKNYGVYSKIYNLELYKRAFVHSSYTKKSDTENAKLNITISEKPNNCLSLKTKSNERLEFIGDGVLELITKYYLYRRFPKADEGFMTEKKIAIVKNEHIGNLALKMKLNRWLLLSRHAEEKNTRNNLKKLGCLFEAFIGAIFLDFNKIDIYDEQGWFHNTFICGPGFQMTQIFVENVFNKHVNWTKIIRIDDNYKNILQVMIQKEFKTTPDYLEIIDDENNSDISDNSDSVNIVDNSMNIVDKYFKMGVYLCLGKSIHTVNIDDALLFETFGNFENIHNYYNENGSAFILIGIGTHKIKKKAEQLACESAINIIKKCNN